jgi:hypothetical protein
LKGEKTVNAVVEKGFDWEESFKEQIQEEMYCFGNI